MSEATQENMKQKVDEYFPDITTKDDEDAPELPKLTLPETVSNITYALEKVDAVIEGGVKNDEDEQAAANALWLIKDTITAVEGEFKSHADLAHKAHKSVTGYRATFIDQLKAKDAELRPVVSKYMQEKRDRERQEAAEARRKAEQDAIDEAAKLEAEGKPAAAEHVLETAPERIEAAAEPPKTTAPKTSSSGLKAPSVWCANVVDHDAFFKALADTPALRDLVKIDEGELNRRAKKIKGKSPIPGVEFIEGVGLSL